MEPEERERLRAPWSALLDGVRHQFGERGRRDDLDRAANRLVDGIVGRGGAGFSVDGFFLHSVERSADGIILRGLIDELSEVSSCRATFTIAPDGASLAGYEVCFGSAWRPPKVAGAVRALIYKKPVRWRHRVTPDGAT